MKACALAKFRSNANALSHSAMPWAARFVELRRRPINICAGACSGASDRALVNLVSAAAIRASLSSVMKWRRLSKVNCDANRLARRHFRDRAPRLGRKSSALATCVPVLSPCIMQATALEIQVHRVGMQRTFRASRFCRDELGIQRVSEP